MATASDDRLIHLWLGRDHGGAQKILLCAPLHPEIEEVTCRLLSNNEVVGSRTVAFQDSVVRLYEFNFPELSDGCEYQYEFMSGGARLDLGGGLQTSDLAFTYWRHLQPHDLVILASCNGIFSCKTASTNPWAMWERMHREISAMRSMPRLIILGGDQYYQDKLEKTWMPRLCRELDGPTQLEFKRQSLANALQHFSALSYRKIMARIPSVAMLDDHDITDGAGGREDYFDGDEFRPPWIRFRDMQLEIFRWLQASRNPRPLLEKHLRAFSFALDLGPAALVALDLRSEKNSRKKRLMEEDHQTALMRALDTLPHQQVMILIPLIPIRYEQTREDQLISLARALNRLCSILAPQWQDVLEGIRCLEDDFADVLCSAQNIPFFADLLRTMAKGARRGVKYTVLSGDIHAAGSTAAEAHVGTEIINFPIIVSSPIGSRPMPWWLEQVSRERGTFEAQHGDVRLLARNRSFSTRRNFIALRPCSLSEPRPERSIYIFEEGRPGCRDLLLRRHFAALPEADRPPPAA